MIIYYVYHVRKHPFLMFRLSISSYSNHKRHQPNIRDGWSLIHSPELLTMTLAKTDSCWHEFEGKEAGRQMDILIPFFYQHSLLPIIVGTPMSTLSFSAGSSNYLVLHSNTSIQIYRCFPMNILQHHTFWGVPQNSLPKRLLLCSKVPFLLCTAFEVKLLQKGV